MTTGNFSKLWFIIDHLKSTALNQRSSSPAVNSSEELGKKRDAGPMPIQ